RRAGEGRPALVDPVADRMLQGVVHADASHEGEGPGDPSSPSLDGLRARILRGVGPARRLPGEAVDGRAAPDDVLLIRRRDQDDPYQERAAPAARPHDVPSVGSW